MMIRAANHKDAAAIAQIYNHYIQHSTATFEEQPIAQAEMLARMTAVAAANLPWLVAEEQHKVCGYAYATQWKDRSAYRFCVETTVYIAPDSHAKGLGTWLYQTLFDELQKAGIHTALGGITLPNNASVALHEKLGMTKVAHLKQVGFKFDQWLDVGYWQVQL